MVPRPDIVAVEIGQPLRAVQDIVLEHGFSRIPAYRDDLDHCEGFVYAKDVLRCLHQGQRDAPIERVMRAAHFVPDSKKAAELLREMQRQKFHAAIVTDEYGSVVGLVTLEDVLEELVGEIEDEMDARETAKAQALADLRSQLDLAKSATRGGPHGYPSHPTAGDEGSRQPAT
jgi:CBS domain containing-hemolysin-like protein